MAIVDVVGHLVADWLGPKVGGHLALFCVHVNRVNSLCHDVRSINIVLGTVNIVTSLYIPVYVSLYIHKSLDLV